MKPEDKESLMSENNSQEESLKVSLTGDLEDSSNNKEKEKNSNKLIMVFLGLVGLFLIVFAGFLLFRNAN